MKEFQLQHGPLSPSNALPRWNESVDAINEISRAVAERQQINGNGPGQRPAIFDTFIGTTTSAYGSVPLTSAQYYVKRAVAPNPAASPPPVYASDGSFLTDHVTCVDDPMNGSLNLPASVVATFFSDLPADYINGGNTAPTDPAIAFGSHSLANGTMVLVVGIPSRANPVQRTYWIIAAARAVPIPVGLSYDGGTDGDATHKPTWTYTVSDYVTGVQYGQHIAPTQNRPNGKTEKATHGTAFAYNDGTVILWWCDEVPTTGVCP